MDKITNLCDMRLSVVNGGEISADEAEAKFLAGQIGKPGPFVDHEGLEQYSKGFQQSGFMQVIPNNIPLRPEVAGIPAAVWSQLSAETRMAVLKDLKLL